MNAAPRRFNPVIEQRAPTPEAAIAARTETGAPVPPIPIDKSVQVLAGELRNLIRRDRKSKYHPGRHPRAGGS